jgi:hypothetical protein
MLNFLTFFRFPKAPMRPQTAATFVASLAVNQSPITDAALTTAALKSKRKMIGRTIREKRKIKRYKFFLVFILHWKPLKEITLGQRETNSNNQTISELASTHIRYEKVIWVIAIWINLIPFTD